MVHIECCPWLDVCAACEKAWDNSKVSLAASGQAGPLELPPSRRTARGSGGRGSPEGKRNSPKGRGRGRGKGRLRKGAMGVRPVGLDTIPEEDPSPSDREHSPSVENEPAEQSDSDGSLPTPVGFAQAGVSGQPARETDSNDGEDEEAVGQLDVPPVPVEANAPAAHSQPQDPPAGGAHHQDDWTDPALDWGDFFPVDEGQETTEQPSAVLDATGQPSAGVDTTGQPSAGADTDKAAKKGMFFHITVQ